MRERGFACGKSEYIFCHKGTKGIAAQWNTGNTLRPELNERKRDLPAANGTTFFPTKA